MTWTEAVLTGLLERSNAHVLKSGGFEKCNQSIRIHEMQASLRCDFNIGIEPLLQIRSLKRAVIAVDLCAGLL